MPETVNDIIKGGSLKLIVASFIIGGVFFRFQSMEAEIVSLTEKNIELELHKASQSNLEVLENRLDKKIKVINENTDRIRSIECKN
tara:strand:- start:775 stop:1032 length:258 start_codon:yes stop_codon:yes gene_type:complete